MAEQVCYHSPKTRHHRLVRLVGVAFYQCSREVASKNAELQHAEANPQPEATLSQHVDDFGQAWDGIQRQWLRKLSSPERKKFDALTTDNEREAFRIIRTGHKRIRRISKSWLNILDGDLACRGVAHGKLRDRFCALGVLRKTAEYVPHKLGSALQVDAMTNGGHQKENAPRPVQPRRGYYPLFYLSPAITLSRMNGKPTKQ